MVCLAHGDTDVFYVVDEVLQGNVYAPYLILPFLHDVFERL